MVGNIAIIVGNSKFDKLPELECCLADTEAIKQLLEATQKYQDIVVISNRTADDLKTELRSAIEKVQNPNELFFYFSGHGYQSETDFFFCATDFDEKSPNQTGISQEELHTLLRLASANLIVKVVDACSSGTLLVKTPSSRYMQSKDGFRNLIQISSCLENQNSLTGNPLSQFTQSFVEAALKKLSGKVYYTDLVNVIRDAYQTNDDQTPFFVSQVTGREIFVEEAKVLQAFANTFFVNDHSSDLPVVHSIELNPPLRTLSERLAAAEEKLATQEKMKNLIGVIFRNLVEGLGSQNHSDFYDREIQERSDYAEPTAERFMIRVLSKESRVDNFVTAENTRTPRRSNPWPSTVSNFQRMISGEDNFEESWILSLNCSLEKAQVSVAMIPKYRSLKKILLVVSCAPSLDKCYVFEVATKHRLRDFGKYESQGEELSRRWWKLNWDQTDNSITKQICEKLESSLTAEIESIESRLSTP